MTKSKSKAVTLIGWTLKKPILKSTFDWSYLDIGSNSVAICTRKGYEKGINIKLFKKVKITIREVVTREK